MSQSAGQGSVRDLERDDISAVARLFQNTFRNGQDVPGALVEYIREVFLDHPWHEEDLRSKVFVGEKGELKGFIGVFPSRLQLEGRPVRAAFAGSMMVQEPERNPLAGARLLRAFLAGPQDISLTETANATALGMWQKLALPLDTAYSLNWLRVFRPVSAAVNAAERRLPSARLLRPLGRAADAVVEKTGVSSLHVSKGATARRISFRDASENEFAEAVLLLSKSFPIRPLWDRAILDWFIGHARQKRALGAPVWRIAESRNGDIAACYAYFGGAGRIGWLLQALCAPAIAGDLVDDLFAHADASGCAGIRGGGHPWLTHELITRKAVFYGRAFFVAHTKDESLLQPIKSGQALISGLAGENWTRLIGDRFD